jgi:hypothetical protein
MDASKGPKIDHLIWRMLFDTNSGPRLQLGNASSHVSPTLTRRHSHYPCSGKWGQVNGVRFGNEGMFGHGFWDNAGRRRDHSP